MPNKSSKPQVESKTTGVEKKPMKKDSKTTSVKSTQKEVIQAEVKVVKKQTGQKKNGLSIDVYDIKGKVVESMELPELFGRKINKPLMTQAVRVYLANQRIGTSSTKTRGEVNGSTRKIYKQKGTGRARHGAKKAPIFVHGGIAFGPSPRDYSLNLSKKMKKAALFSALSTKYKDSAVKVVSGMEALSLKTKLMADVLNTLGLMTKNKKVLFVLPESQEKSVENIKKSARNIEGINVVLANQLTTYTVLGHTQLLFTKAAIEAMQSVFVKGKDNE